MIEVEQVNVAFAAIDTWMVRQILS